MDYSYYSSYDISPYAREFSDSSTIAAGAIGSMLAIYFVIILAVAILQIIAMWKIFTKAGEKGWKSIIPIYNLVTLFKISGLSPWLILVYLLGAIPIVGGIICLILLIYQANSLAKAFGKDVGYTIGLILLPTIFYMILGFGKSQYVGNGGFSTASTSYQGDGVVNVSEKPVDEPPTNNDEDNSNL